MPKHGTLSGINTMKFIKNMLAKRIVKKLVKLVSKNNPYALAAVELYGLYELISDQKDKKDGSERKEK